MISQERQGGPAFWAVRFRRGLSCLLLILASLSLSMACGSLPFQSVLIEDTFSYGRQETVELSLEKPIEREMAGGGKHVYTVSVQAGEFARVIVDQRGIDVVVKVFTPEGTLITTVDNPNGSNGAEPVQIVASTSAIYRLEVISYEPTAPAGRYEAKVVELRAATQRDRDWAVARRTFDAAEHLAAAGSRAGYRDAVPYYQQARQLYRAYGDRSEEFTSVFGLGLTYRQAGDYANALAAFNEALPIAQALGDNYRQGRIFEFTAAVQIAMGDLEKGLQARVEALRLYQAAGDKLGEAELLNLVGNSYNVLGEHEKARTSFERAILLYRRLGMKTAEALSMRDIGYTYDLEEQPAKSSEYYQKALAILRTEGSSHEIASTLSMTSSDYRTPAGRKAALDCVAEVIRLGKSAPGSMAALMLNVGTTYQKLGDFDKALESFQEPLRQFREKGNKRSEAIAMRHIALALRDKGQLNEARAAIEKSIELLEFLREHSTNPELRASFVSTLFHFYEFYADLRMQMSAATPGSGDDAAALEFVEKVKVRSLVELLTRANVDLRDGVDGQLLNRERILDENITSKLDELSKAFRAKSTQSDKDRIEADLEKLQESYRQLQSEVREASPHYAGFADPKPLSVKDIQQTVLDKDTVLLEYSLGDERSYLWVVTHDGLKSYELPPRAEIEAQARRVYAVLTSRRPAPMQNSIISTRTNPVPDDAYWRESNKLSSMLIAPAAAELGRKRLLIVADGALQYLPFAALPAPGPNGKPANKPLIEDHEVVSAPSASVLAVLRQEFGKRAAAPKLAAIVADPVYAADDSRVKASDGQQRGSGDSSPYRRLLFSRAEADAILSQAPPQSSMAALDFDSTRQLAMSPELANYRILHFSTHGVADSRRPELSGLVLSQVDRSGKPQEGFLRLHEIYNLRIKADLVVLSACQTGLGKEVRGEGLISLTRGFMYAGAPRVIASLWQVDDAATAELMKRFYRGVLKQGLPAAAALRAAQLEMLRKKSWQSPYYWGAFVLQGEWK